MLLWFCNFYDICADVLRSNHLGHNNIYFLRFCLDMFPQCSILLHSLELIFVVFIYNPVFVLFGFSWLGETNIPCITWKCICKLELFLHENMICRDICWLHFRRFVGDTKIALLSDVFRWQTILIHSLMLLKSHRLRRMNCDLQWCLSILCLILIFLIDQWYTRIGQESLNLFLRVGCQYQILFQHVLVW